jgi:polysaccharide export outer membrane protein
MMKLLKAFLLASCGVTSCFAQKESLTIGPADLLHIRVLEAPELEQSGRVTDAGTFPLIIGGSVTVTGLTPSRAAEAIAHALEDGHFFLTPHISVIIEQTTTQNVIVSGSISHPGSYPLPTARPVLDVLALAGGLNDFADRKITIERHDTKQRIEFFVSNESAHALDNNSLLVYPGDTVVVPRASFVYVLGDVGRPGGYAMTTNDSTLSVLQVIAQAGGTPPTAVPAKARLIRKMANGTYVELALPLSAMQKGRAADMQLQTDDIIYVPFSYLRSMALGIDSLVAAAVAASIYRF